MKNRFASNISWIFFGNAVHAALQFALNIICARAFGTDDYGLINYGASLIALFSAASMLGLNGVITRFLAEDEDKAGELLGSGIVARTVCAVISIIALQLIAALSGQSDAQIRVIVLCQSFQILFASADLLVYWFRFRNEARTVALIRLGAFFISAIWKLAAVLHFHDLVLYVVGTALETAMFALFQLLCFRKSYGQYRLSFSWDVFRRMIAVSYPFIFSALLITVYGQTDKVMLKNMLSNSSVGLYSAALTLAGAISILPNALIEGFRPSIMSYRLTSRENYRCRIQQLYGLVFWICVAYGLVITVFARWILLKVYGADYVPASSALALVVWYTSFSYFGAINSIYMVAEDKARWVQITTLAGAAMNFLMNITLIPSMGINGAALASLITQFFTNFVMLAIIPALREAFVLAVEGMALRGFRGWNLNELKTMLRKQPEEKV